MKSQRWDGDYETKEQEFRASRAQEQVGMEAVNRSFMNDYIANPGRPLNQYQRSELEPSWASQLDVVGMQPHAREYLEREMNGSRSERDFHVFEGGYIDHPEGIQFSGRP